LINRVLVENPFDGRIEQAGEFQVCKRFVVPEIDRNYRSRLEVVEIGKMGGGEFSRQHAPEREIWDGADDGAGVDPLPAPQSHAGRRVASRIDSGRFVSGRIEFARLDSGKLDSGDVGVQSNLAASVFDKAPGLLRVKIAQPHTRNDHR